METFELQATVRNPEGSRQARNIRRREMVPAIVYGHGMKPLSLEVPERTLSRALHTKAGENILISLKVEGMNLKESTCRIKDIQQNPVSDKIDHVDFMIISLTEKIKVMVPVVAIHGEEAVGVKEGGVLDVVHHEIEVECLPTQIPEKVEVDTKAMKINDSVHTKDLALPEGVKCLLPDDEVIVAVHPPREEEVKPAGEEAATQPEVIEKGKKEKEGEEGAAKPAAAPAAKPAAAPAKDAK